MSNPKTCAACGAVATGLTPGDGLYVCAACLALPGQPAAEVVPPPARAAPPVSSPAPLEWTGPPLLQNRMRWRVVADGYRDLRFAMLSLLLALPLSFGVRLVEKLTSPPPRYGEDPPQFMHLGSVVFVLLAFVALVKFLYGAVALAKKPPGPEESSLPFNLAVFAFVPVMNVIVFPILLSLYTGEIGRELGKRSLVRSAWVLFGCAVIRVPAVLYAIYSVLKWALEPETNRPTDLNPSPASFELLFGVGAGAILWLVAYIVTITVLSGVPRVIEKRLREQNTPDDLVPDPEPVTDETP